MRVVAVTFALLASSASLSLAQSRDECLQAVASAERDYITPSAAYDRIKRDFGPLAAHSFACSGAGWRKVGWLERLQKARQAGQRFDEPEPPEASTTIFCKCNKKFPIKRK